MSQRNKHPPPGIHVNVYNCSSLLGMLVLCSCSAAVIVLVQIGLNTSGQCYLSHTTSYQTQCDFIMSMSIGTLASCLILGVVHCCLGGRYKCCDTSRALDLVFYTMCSILWLTLSIQLTEHVLASQDLDKLRSSQRNTVVVLSWTQVIVSTVLLCFCVSNYSSTKWCCKQEHNILVVEEA